MKQSNARTVYIIFTYFAIDALLRILTRWLGYYSIYQIAPSLFSLCWIVIIVCILSLFPLKTGRIVYGITYFGMSLYSVVQYVYYLVFSKFLFLSDIKLAHEGMDYVGYIKSVIDITVYLQVGVLFFLGITGIIFFPDFRQVVFLRKGLSAKSIIIFICATCIACTPILFSFDQNETVNAKYEYNTFTSSGFDLEIAGFYQYMARDMWITYLKPKEDPKEYIEEIDSFLMKSHSLPHIENEMTGLLEGKNVIVVQLETIDDWMINEKDTPCISRMMREGINFTNMYTPCFGTGWTFGTEFAFNAGVYQGSTVFSGERLARNHYPLSVAKLALSKGYVCNSLHENRGSYYSRSSMHTVFGYTYHCSQDHLETDEYEMDDTTLVSNNQCWEILTHNKPFFSFLITMSGHLPYNEQDEVVQYAYKKHREYDELKDETNNLQLKARLTDDMFSSMLTRLEEDGLLKNTVIIAYDDHYSYGLSDKKELQQLSEEAGSTILEKTPAFIWYEGCQPKEISKVCQTIDWLPTIANMLNVQIFDKVLGNDIFDPDYVGYAVFPDNTWLYNDCYVKNGKVVNSGSLSAESIEGCKEFFSDFYTINQYILQSDYYGNNSERFSWINHDE